MSDDCNDPECAGCGPDFNWDEFYDAVKENIKLHGCHLTGVFDAEVPFTYTTGLALQDIPELILTGMNMHQAAPIINLIARKAIAGTLELHDGDVLALDEYNNLPMALIKVSDEFRGELMGVTNRYMRENDKESYDALQIVWCDTDNKFPWDEGFEERFRKHLPLLGEVSLL